MNNFVPLRIISCYSFLQSGLTMEKIAASTYKNGYFGLGLADNGVLFGVPEFVKASEKIKKPYIVGLEVRVNDDFICLYARITRHKIKYLFIDKGIMKCLFAAPLNRCQKQWMIWA